MEIIFAGILFLVVMCRQGSIDAAQSFLEQPHTSSVKPGETVTLKCTIKDKLGDCMWQKDHTPLGLSPGKYEWVGNQKSGDCSIKILDAHADTDEGYWSCQVTWSSLKARDALNSAKIYLSVGEHCTIGKPCSRKQNDDKIHNDAESGEISGRQVPSTSINQQLQKPYTPYTTHHRVKGSNRANRVKYDRHPFATIFAYKYLVRTTKPFIKNPRKSLDLLEGLHHLHYHHDHDLAFG